MIFLNNEISCYVGITKKIERYILISTEISISVSASNIQFQSCYKNPHYDNKDISVHDTSSWLKLRARFSTGSHSAGSSTVSVSSSSVLENRPDLRTHPDSVKPVRRHIHVTPRHRCDTELAFPQTSEAVKDRKTPP